MSLTFHFNEVCRVTGARPYLTGDGTTERRPWVGVWREYETRHGIRVPVEGEVAWGRPEGFVPYWRGRVNRIKHGYSSDAVDETDRVLNDGERV